MGYEQKSANIIYMSVCPFEVILHSKETIYYNPFLKTRVYKDVKLYAVSNICTCPFFISNDVISVYNYYNPVKLPPNTILLIKKLIMK